MAEFPEPGRAARGPRGKRALERWAHRVSWCGPALVMLALGLLHVQWPELWRDELASWSIASRSLPEMIATARNVDGAELPYYAVLHYWMAVLGPSVLSLRILSVLAMAGAAAFVALTGREVAGTRTGILAGLVFSGIPSVSRFAQEVRFYALAMMFAALATWLLVRALDRPSWPRWAGYAVAMAALGYSDIVALSLLAGHACWTALSWWRRRDPRLARFAAGAAASVLLCVPLMLLGSREAASQVGWVPRIGFGPADYSPAWFAANLFFSRRVALAVLALAALAWAARDRRGAGRLTAFTLLPLASVWLISQGEISYFFPRYVLFTLIGVSVLAGMTLSRLSRWRCRGAGLGWVPTAVLMAVTVAVGLPDQGMIRAQDAHEWAAYPDGVLRGTYEYELAARIVGASARPGDGIAYASGPQETEQVNLGVSYYLGSLLKPGVPAPRTLFNATPVARSRGLYPLPCAQPARCAGDQPRVWLIGNYPAPGPFTVLVPGQADVLRRHYKVSRTWRVGENLAVVLLVRS